MRMSGLFGRTLREDPADAELPSHKLLVRAAFIRPLAAGIYQTLPLGQRTMARIEAILREEMNRIGAQEIRMPVVQPAELWQQTGRWSEIGGEMARLKDRAERDMVLAMTHEEAVTALAATEIQSYRHLPQVVYQIQTKFRDEPRPRGGLIRTREFVMKDAYSFSADDASLDEAYQAQYGAYGRIFERCGLETVVVASDTGIMGGKEAHEFMALSPYGEDTLILCDACAYAANQQIAGLRRDEPPAEPMGAVAEVPTPSCTTIAALSALLGVPPRKTAKAVMYIRTAGGPLILGLVRGDLELSLSKLARAVGTAELRPATPEEIRAAGAEAGYTSAVGLKSAEVYVDESVARARNLYGGANREGFHLSNLNYERDFQGTVTDLAEAQAGSPCPQCGAPMREARGIEVGNIFKLGTRYSTALGATFLDADGKQRPIIMGSYGIGVGRLMAAIAEQRHDERGICWPESVAPYSVHLVGLNLEVNEVNEAAESLYAGLQAAGHEVLFDDRAENAGVKFNDADLIGIPVRLTVSRRTVGQGLAEMKRRDSDTAVTVPLEKAGRGEWS
jgi:prolyl-tRNA synthetase